MTTSHNPLNPTDIYATMLEVKNGQRGCFSVSKKNMKANGVEWSFVENSAEILGLQVVRDGNFGYLVSRKH